MNDAQQAIPVVTSKEKANYPFVVQVRNTENWNTHGATVTLAAAQEVAREVLAKFPKLPVRIEHCLGGLLPTELVPAWTQCGPGEVPYKTALWSGIGAPPPVGTRVYVNVNGIGPGTVNGFAVDEGYLGLLVTADEATRPAWHKRQNPVNGPMLTMGAELRPTMPDLYALWDKLGDIPVDNDGLLLEPFFQFAVGYSRAQLWTWFEQRNPAFKLVEVQQGIRKEA